MTFLDKQRSLIL